MQDDKLKRFEDALNLATRDTVTEGDFIVAFKQVMEVIKSSNNATAGVLEEVFTRLDTFANELKGDSEQDRNLVKQAVGQAMASLRVDLDSLTATQNAKLDAKLASITQPEDGKDADVTGLVDEVLSKIPKPVEPPPETPDETVEKINKSTLLIAKERVEGLVDAIRQAVANSGSMPVTTSFFNGLRGKNLNIVGATATQQGDTVYVTPTGGTGGGQVNSVVAGTGISVNSTDPANPIVSATGTTPGGLNLQVQYNNGGVFGGISGAVTNGTILNLTNPLIGGATITTSTVNGVTLTTGGGTTTFLNANGTYTTPAGGGSGITRSISSVSTATAMGATAAVDYVYFVSGTTTMTLPTAVGNTNRYTLVHTDTSTMTIATTSAQTISFYPPSPSTTATVIVQGTVVELYSDGSNWWTI